MKWCNKKTSYNKIDFDSEVEARFYQHITTVIHIDLTNLTLQPEFTLQDGFVDSTTLKKVLPIKYVGDFQVGRTVYDVKGTRYSKSKKTGKQLVKPFSTADFKLKAKMFKHRFNGVLELLVVYWNKYTESWVYE